MATAARTATSFSRANPPRPEDVLSLWRDAAAALYRFRAGLEAFAAAADALPTGALPGHELETTADDAAHMLWALSSYESMLTDSMPIHLVEAAHRQARRGA